MSDFVESNPSSGGAKWAVDRIAGIDYPRHKMVLGADGVDGGDVSASNPMPVAGTVAVTNADLTALGNATHAEDTPFTTGDIGIHMLAVRQDAMSALGADGDYTPLQVGATGRLKVSAEPAAQVSVTGNITANGQTVQIASDRTSNLMIYCTGTFSGSNCTFEGSLNGTNWFAVQAIRSNANTIELTTGVLGAAPAYAWEVSCNGMNFFRVRATAFVSGTQVWQLQPAPYATEPIPAAQISGTQPVSGSVTATLAAAVVRAGFVAGAGIWFDDTATALAANATFTGASRDLTVTATAVAFANAATYAMEVRVSAESDVTGTLWIETSRDNTNWRRVKAVATTAVTGGGFAAEIIHRPSWRYLRVGYTNGATVQARLTVGSVLMAG